jgi:hypothetical protein
VNSGDAVDQCGFRRGVSTPSHSSALFFFSFITRGADGCCGCSRDSDADNRVRVLAQFALVLVPKVYNCKMSWRRQTAAIPLVVPRRPVHEVKTVIDCYDMRAMYVVKPNPGVGTLCHDFYTPAGDEWVSRIASLKGLPSECVVEVVVQIFDDGSVCLKELLSAIEVAEMEDDVPVLTREQAFACFKLLSSDYDWFNRSNAKVFGWDWGLVISPDACAECERCRRCGASSIYYRVMNV